MTRDGEYVLLKQAGSISQSGGSSSAVERKPFIISTRLVLGLSALFLLSLFPPSALRFSRTEDLPQQQTPVLSIATTAQAAEPLRHQCVPDAPPIATPPAPVNLWASLTILETVAIAEWLSNSTQNLNLTRADTAVLSDNFIFHIEVYHPPKAAALQYLTSPSTETLPERYSRVTIHHGGRKDKDGGPIVQDYLVGPLPISGHTTIRKLTEIYHRDDIPFNARSFAIPTEMSPLLLKHMPKLAHAMQDLLGGVAVGLPNDTLTAGASGPMSFDGSFRRTWVSWRRNVPGPWLHPTNFFQYIDVSGTDPNKWKILKLVYNHQMFSSVDEFLEAYNNGTLLRLPHRPDQTTDLDWSTRIRPNKTAPRDLDHLPGPRQVSFAGLRYRVDRVTQYISWLGWGFYLGFNRDMGLSLWDIRFMGDRIIYEISPQDALAQYAGNDPMQTTTAWLDRFFGMGSSVRDLLPGYDCPHEATFLPATTHMSVGSITRLSAICVFEHDSGRPITRHTGYMKGEFGAVKGYNLVVRSISTVGNGEFGNTIGNSWVIVNGREQFDYIFHIDGTIEVRVSASGYLQAGFWEPSQEGYGTAIRQTTMGSLHDHVINFKVDLDVLGTNNSLLYTHTAQEQVTQPWFDDDWGEVVIQQKIKRDYIENEDDARLKLPLNFQGGYSIVNKDETNSWGISRGYAIHPGYSPVYNTVVGSKRLLENANWARYNLAVSKRKDEEPASSSMWNMNLPGAPMVNFHEFFDGENITQEDLVAWVNVGMHHLPQAEDAPNTRTNLAASSFFLTPLNYFDSDISMDSLNAILLTPPEEPGNAYTYEDYGVKPVNCVPNPVAPFSYIGLRASGLDGKEAPPATTEELRRQAELYHRIKLEL